MMWNRNALSFIVAKMIEYLTSTVINFCLIFCGSKKIRKLVISMSPVFAAVTEF